MRSCRGGNRPWALRVVACAFERVRLVTFGHHSQTVGAPIYLHDVHQLRQRALHSHGRIAGLQFAEPFRQLFDMICKQY